MKLEDYIKKEQTTRTTIKKLTELMKLSSEDIKIIDKHKHIYTLQKDLLNLYTEKHLKENELLFWGGDKEEHCLYNIKNEYGSITHHMFIDDFEKAKLFYIETIIEYGIERVIIRKIGKEYLKKKMRDRLDENVCELSIKIKE